MTEAEWRDCLDPRPLFTRLGERLDARRVRLCACAWARQVWGRLKDDRSRAAVGVAERFADGLATGAELELAHREAEAAWAAIPEYTGSRRAMRQSARGRQALKDAARVASNAAHPNLSRWYLLGRPKAMAFLAAAVRDLYGPLAFRPVVADAAWLSWNGGVIPALAAEIYEDGSFEQVTFLADALADAGCADPDVLEHLREESPHLRGCWLVDLLRRRPDTPDDREGGPA